MRLKRLGLMVAAVLAASSAAGAAATPEKPPRLDPLAVAKSVEAATEDAADRVAPAVVNILVVHESGGPGAGPEGGLRIPDNLPDELRERLRDYFERQWRDAPESPFRTQGNGSGVLISDDGFILTSEHVVRDATTIEVTLASRKKYPAKIVGSDPRRDLAVIKVEATGLPVARLGDAARLRRGQFVLALGSPFGFGRDGQASLSFGIVSGTGRAIPSIGRELDRYYGNLIQTDAAVNPGNSGGPLVTLDGEVVGVNAVISSRDGASDGVGFAVPIDARTRQIIERLKRGEQIEYGYLGVEIQEVTAEETVRTGAEPGLGAYVASVLPDTPAAKAGLAPGDVILRVGDAPVHGPDDVIQIVQATPVGQDLALTVLRGGKERQMKVGVARRPVPEALAAERMGLRGWVWRGMRVEPLTQELREQADLKSEQEGVFVREVRDASPAAEAGITPGMVLDQVGEKKVASVAEFHAAAAGAEGPVSVHVVGGGVKVVQAPGAKKDAPQPPQEPEKQEKPEKPQEQGGPAKKD
jgi:serine protease Do